MPWALRGPLMVAGMVTMTLVEIPGVALWTVLVTATSELETGVALSSWLLLAPLGSAAAPSTLAVLARVPVAAGEIVDAAVGVTPPAPTQVQLQVSTPGTLSVTVAVVFDNPAFEAVLV